MDLNGDGFVEENELKEHINFMQRRYVDNDVERTWKNYNQEKVKDGQLSWGDYRFDLNLIDLYFFKGYFDYLYIYYAFREMVYGSSDGEGQELSPEYAKMISRDELRWKKADYDSNGVLDRTEYGCFMHPEDCDHMRDIVVQV